MDNRKHHLPLILLSAVVLAREPALAQTTPASLSEVLGSGFGLVVDEDLAGQLNTAISSQVATYPVGTSSGAFTYSFDPALGIVSRTTRGFGSAFAMRAPTIGARGASIGVNFQRATFDRFEGRDLTKLQLAHGTEFTTSGGLRTSTTELRIDLRTATTSVVAEFGLHPRVDVAVITPIVSVDIDATVRQVEDDGVVQTLARGGRASGLGDIVVRLKYNFFRRESTGWATGVDVNLPTGDLENLRGAGYARLEIFAIGSTETSVFGPHVNIGFTLPVTSALTRAVFPLTSQGVQDWELAYTGGTEFIPHPRVTLIADIIGRTRGRVGRFGDLNDPDSGVTRFVLLNTASDPLTQILASIGMKLNVHRTLLVTASVLVPATEAGLAARLASVVGFDWGF